jgi:hemerythrin-like domain-containing protein
MMMNLRNNLSIAADEKYYFFLIPSNRKSKRSFVNVIRLGEQFWRHISKERLDNFLIKIHRSVKNVAWSEVAKEASSFIDEIAKEISLRIFGFAFFEKDAR